MRTLCCAPILILLLWTFGCTTATYERLAEDLMSDDPVRIQLATEKLAADPKLYPRAASALVVQDPKTRERFMAVFHRAGDRAIPVFTDNIATINVSGAHFDMFVTFFREREDRGYQALLRHFDLHAQALKEGVLAKDFGIATMDHLKRMDDISRVLMALPPTDVGSLPSWLTHPFEGAREQTAKVLCAKGWSPPENSPGPEPQIYYSLLSALIGCNQAVMALEKMTLLARKDLPAFLAVESVFPSPHGVFYRVLAEAATDEVVAYIESACADTRNEFLFVQYWRVLKAIKTPASEQAQKRLLAREDLPDLFAALVRKTDQNSSASAVRIPTKSW